MKQYIEPVSTIASPIIITERIFFIASGFLPIPSTDFATDHPCATETIEDPKTATAAANIVSP